MTRRVGFPVYASLLGLAFWGCGSGSAGPGTSSGGSSAVGGANGTGASSSTTGGASGNGGGVNTGGNGGGANAGGSAAGGSAVTGGSAAGGAATSGGAGGGQGVGGAGCANTNSGTFAVEKQLASAAEPEAPTTVGVVTWSVEGFTPDSARIEFGLTTAYGMTAPVDLKEKDFRTLLLGMKGEETYHFRIVATVGCQEIPSEDNTIETGAVPSSVVTAVGITKYDIISADKREPGFIVSSYWQGTPKGWVFILDQDGDIVWWHNSGISGGVAKAAISMDAKDMWMISASNQGEAVRRVAMDGLDPKTYTNAVGSHDIQPVSGDKMIFIEYGETDCDSIFEINKAGETKDVLELEGFMPKGMCHGNSVAYNKAKKSYVISSLDVDVFMSPEGVVATSANTTLLTKAAGAISTWGGIQHGVQLLNNNNLLIFANKEGGANGPSVAIEYSLDSGKEVWRYESEGKEFTANLGDVQRLPGGNTLVTYSNAGIIHEVTADQTKVLEIAGQKNFGYATWRKSLYGDSEDTLE